MIIDADVHFSPLAGDNRIGVDEALRRMDHAGVDKALCWLQPSYIRKVYEQTAYIHRAMVQHPDRILGFGWANPHLGLDKAKVTRVFLELQILVVHMGGAGVPDMSEAVIEFAQGCPNVHLIGSCIFIWLTCNPTWAW